MIISYVERRGILTNIEYRCILFTSKIGSFKNIFCEHRHSRKWLIYWAILCYGDKVAL